MTLVEEAWTAPDYRFAVITNQFLDRKKFHIVLESKILNHDRVLVFHCGLWIGRERQRVPAHRQ